MKFFLSIPWLMLSFDYSSATKQELENSFNNYIKMARRTIPELRDLSSMLDLKKNIHGNDFFVVVVFMGIFINEEFADSLIEKSKNTSRLPSRLFIFDEEVHKYSQVVKRVMNDHRKIQCEEYILGKEASPIIVSCFIGDLLFIISELIDSFNKARNNEKSTKKQGKKNIDRLDDILKRGVDRFVRSMLLKMPGSILNWCDPKKLTKILSLWSKTMAGYSYFERLRNYYSVFEIRKLSPRGVLCDHSKFSLTIDSKFLKNMRVLWHDNSYVDHLAFF